VLLLAAGAARGAEPIRLAVVIGNNRGHDPARALRYAENDARKVHQVLTELGGVPAANAQLLLGRSAGDAWRAIQRAATQLRALRVKEPGRPLILLLYYSGHADGSVLELGGSSLRYDALTAFLRSSQADVRLAFVDSCRSGQLVAMKGGRRTEAYRIQVSDEWSRGFAVITSSAADELSQEAAEIRGSYFTHYLVSGLRGAADQSGDGKVTLDEAYRYAYRRTVARTSGTVGGSQHPMYDFKLAGRGDIVLTSRAGASTLEVASPAPGRVLVLDDAGQAMVAEGQVAPEQPLRLALARGRYQVLLVERGRLARARVALAGTGARVDRRAFVSERASPAWAKGGPFRPRAVHRLSAGLSLGRMPLAESSVTLGAALEYQVEPWPGLRLIGRVRWATAPDAGLSTGYHELGTLAGIGYGFRFRVPLVLSLLAGHELLRQGEREGSRYSSALSYLGSAGLELPLGDLLVQVAGGVGGRVFKLREGELAHRLDLQLIVGAGWRFGEH
jgi:hypothetical protein